MVLGAGAIVLFLMIGERQVPAGTASILIATAPLFSVFAAALLLGESARGRWPGMLLAALGSVIVGASLNLGGGVFVAAVILASACQGLYHVIAKPLSQAVGAYGATAWSLWAGAVLALPAVPWLAADLRSASTSAITATLFLGIVPSAVGYVSWSFALARSSHAHPSQTPRQRCTSSHSSPSWSLGCGSVSGPQCFRSSAELWRSWESFWCSEVGRAECRRLRT